MSDTDTPQITSEEEATGTEATLIEHLTELRNRLIKALVAIVVLFGICVFFATDIFEYLLAPFSRAAGGIENVELIFTAPQEFFFTKLKVALFAALFFAFPIVAGQIYSFVAPGLYKNEKGAFLPFIVATPLLFVAGASLVYFGVMPLAIKFFLSQELSGEGHANIQMLPRVSEYLSLTMTLLLAFGAFFQMPVLLTLLARVELITADNLKSWRKYAVVCILVLAAFLTPPDPITQMGLALPVFLLYEISIILVKMIERSRSRRLKDLGLDE